LSLPLTVAAVANVVVVVVVDDAAAVDAAARDVALAIERLHRYFESKLSHCHDSLELY
jgi:hypothetical protein